MELMDHGFNFGKERLASLSSTKPLVGLLDFFLPAVNAKNWPGDLHTSSQAPLDQGLRNVFCLLASFGRGRYLNDFGHAVFIAQGERQRCSSTSERMDYGLLELRTTCSGLWFSKSASNDEADAFSKVPLRQQGIFTAARR